MNYFKGVVGFFSGLGAKLYIYIAIVLAIIVAITSFYFYAYNKGATNEKNKLASEYALILEQTIKDNSARISAQYELKLKAVKEKENVKEDFKEKSQKIDKAIEKSDALNNANCYQEESTLEEFNKSIKRPKK